VLAAVGVAAPAHAYVYWTQGNGSGGPIGRANLDGGGIRERLATRASSSGIAVDAAHIYWANYTGSVGRASLTGTGVNQRYIRAAGASELAVDGLGPKVTPKPHGGTPSRLPQPIQFFYSVANIIKAPGQPVEGEAVRPSTIALFADGAWVLQGLHWSGWGSKVATGKGISSASNGKPNIAQGKRLKTPASITLSDPGRFFGREVYRCYQLHVRPPASELHGCLGGHAGYWLLGT
jgi:hypothetical protein